MVPGACPSGVRSDVSCAGPWLPHSALQPTRLWSCALYSLSCAGGSSVSICSLGPASGTNSMPGTPLKGRTNPWPEPGCASATPPASASRCEEPWAAHLVRIFGGCSPDPSVPRGLARRLPLGRLPLPRAEGTQRPAGSLRPGLGLRTPLLGGPGPDSEPFLAVPALGAFSWTAAWAAPLGLLRAWHRLASVKALRVQAARTDRTRLRAVAPARRVGLPRTRDSRR